MYIDKNEILVSTAYLPPIAYLKALIESRFVVVEQFENYIKQTYRNRCKIFAANGVMSLSVPVELATTKKILIKDVKIDYREAWQKQHLRSIESAYGTSPFFEYLIDDFLPFYSNEYKFLLDYNQGLLDVILDILQADVPRSLSVDYEHIPANANNLRNHFNPKKDNIDVQLQNPYPQVFSAKFGFQPNLSCIDLVFNLGPGAYSYLIGKY